MESVFSNSLIMAVITDNLCLEDIKNLRLVNQSMNTMTLPILSRRNITLVISTSIISHPEFAPMFLQVNPIFVKNVRLNEDTVATEELDSAMPLVLGFFEIHEQFIRKLEIISSARFAEISHFSEILTKFQFPSLTHLSVQDEWMFIENLQHIEDNNLATQYPSLTTFKFEISRNSRKRADFTGLIQFVINKSSTSLEELVLQGENFEGLDLGGCSLLKKLKISVPYFELNQNVDIDAICGMLDQVKTTLDELTLDIRLDTPFPPELPENCRMPSSLPNLKSLKVYGLDVFDIGKEALDPAKYPQLQYLALGCRTFSFARKLDSCLNLSNIPILSVTELELMGSKSLQLLRKAQYLFPNVSSLTVQPGIHLMWFESLHPMWFESLAVMSNANFVPYCTALCDTWNITRLKMVTQCQLAWLIQGLQHIPIENLQVLHLSTFTSVDQKRQNIDERTFSLSPKFKTTLLRTKNLEKFIISSGQPSDIRLMNAIKKFAEQHQLPLCIN